MVPAGEEMALAAAQTNVSTGKKLGLLELLWIVGCCRLPVCWCLMILALETDYETDFRTKVNGQPIKQGKNPKAVHGNHGMRISSFKSSIQTDLFQQSY